MNFETWWTGKKDSFSGSVCDRLIIKHHLKIGWDAHAAESMKPLVEEIKADADNIKHNATELANKINKYL